MEASRQAFAEGARAKQKKETELGKMLQGSSNQGAGAPSVK
jgi:hypothetical protein